MDELMQEARFYKLNGNHIKKKTIVTVTITNKQIDLLKLKWKDLPIISQGKKKKEILISSHIK